MSEPIRTRAGVPLTVLFLVNVLNYYDRQALGAVVEPLRHEFHLNDTQLALIPTLFTIIYAVAGLPLGPQLLSIGSPSSCTAFPSIIAFMDPGPTKLQGP